MPIIPFNGKTAEKKLKRLTHFTHLQKILVDFFNLKKEGNTTSVNGQTYPNNCKCSKY